MALWQRTLDISKEWEAAGDGETVQEIQALSAAIAVKLAALLPFGIAHIDDSKQELVDEFNNLANDPNVSLESFNSLMNDLYDWADISLDEHWNGKKVCWVERL